MNLFTKATDLTPAEDAVLYEEYKTWCAKHGGMLPCWQGFMTWKVCRLEASSNGHCVSVPSCGTMQS